MVSRAGLNCMEERENVASANDEMQAIQPVVCCYINGAILTSAVSLSFLLTHAMKYDSG
jgi:hypothetical protein